MKIKKSRKFFITSRDEEFIGSLVSAVSVINNLEIVVTNSGSGLKKKLRDLLKTTENGVKLILIDDDLEDIRGVELLREVKGIMQEIKIIFVARDSKVEQEIRREGVYFFITKPIEKEIIKKLVNKAIEHETDRLVKAEKGIDLNENL